jgi:hypothetical protein
MFLGYDPDLFLFQYLFSWITACLAKQPKKSAGGKKVKSAIIKKSAAVVAVKKKSHIPFLESAAAVVAAKKKSVPSQQELVVAVKEKLLPIQEKLPATAVAVKEKSVLIQDMNLPAVRSMPDVVTDIVPIVGSIESLPICLPKPCRKLVTRTNKSRTKKLQEQIVLSDQMKIQIPNPKI